MIDFYGGRVVKLLNDGLPAEFPSVIGAAERAFEIQNKIAAIFACAPNE